MSISTIMTSSHSSAVTSEVVLDKGHCPQNLQKHNTLIQRVSHLQTKLQMKKSMGQLNKQMQDQQIHKEAQNKVEKARAAIAHSLCLKRDLTNQKKGGPGNSGESIGHSDSMVTDNRSQRANMSMLKLKPLKLASDIHP